jgi:hypothetical protein
MEVKIGVQHAPRELVLDTAETAEEIEKNLAAAVASGESFAISDNRGRRILIPAGGIAYVEIGGGVAGQVGFRS